MPGQLRNQTDENHRYSKDIGGGGERPRAICPVLNWENSAARVSILVSQPRFY